MTGRIRLRRAPRPNVLLLERDGEPAGSVELGRGKEIVIRLPIGSFELETGDGWDVTLRGRDGEPAAIHDDRRVRDDRIAIGGREYALELPDGDKRGELRDDAGDRVASLEMRHPEHGSVLILETDRDLDDVLVAFAATITYLRTGAPRRTRRYGEIASPQAAVTAGVFSYAVGGGFEGGGFDAGR